MRIYVQYSLRRSPLLSDRTFGFDTMMATPISYPSDTMPGHRLSTLSRYVNFLLEYHTLFEPLYTYLLVKMKLLFFALTASAVQVDLGYSIYEGSLQSGLNVWQGIRYAAPPERWQAPQPPVTDRKVIQANGVPNQCLQAGSNTDVPGSGLDYANHPLGGIGSEDCLYLSVYAPPNARNLPVVVWIHGGGYGLGNGNQNLTDLILANNKAFIGVTIQYRLGALGFLSSDEVDRYGTVNAGLKDQTFALRWLQKYIRLFGGNPREVTIFGESAGAGSVMLQSIIYDGNLGTSLFKNVGRLTPEILALFLRSA